MNESRVGNHLLEIPSNETAGTEDGTLRPSFPTDIPTAVSTAEATELFRLADNGRVLELGAQYGFSTIVLARAARQVHSVDWHKGDSMAGYVDTLNVFLTNLRRYGVGNVIAHVGRFEGILDVFGDRVFDGCFIDGEHDLDSVKRDTTMALRLVRPGGWVAWHDYGRPGCAVAPIVDEIAALHRAELGRTEFLAWLSLPHDEPLRIAQSSSTHC